jgi:competence protein ComEC
LSSFQFFLVENISINIFEVILLFIFLYYLRFVFKNFSLSKVIKPAYILVLFIAVRVGFYFYFQEKSEILSHQFYKQNIISTKENGKVIFYMKESVDEQKAIQFLINPYLTSRRTNDFEIKKLPKSINYIQFNGVKYDLE